MRCFSPHLAPHVRAPSSPSVVFTNDGVMWQVIIHAVFVLSAIALAWTDRLMGATPAPNH